MKLIDAKPEHFAAILDLNEAAIPHVNRISLADLEKLADMACSFRLALHDDRVAGFLLALKPGQAYDSINYGWFSKTFERFVYVDRIVVDTQVVRSGLGSALYADLAEQFPDEPRITCEVNLRPANPRSIAFHQRLGFEEVGQQDTENGEKRVSLMSRTITQRLN